MPAARQRAAGRGQPGRRQRQAAPLRRRAPAPCAGLDEVEKVLSRWRQALAVVASHVGSVPVERIQQSDRVDLGHPLGDLVRREPADRGRFAGRALASAGGLAPEDQGHDAARGVLVDPCELVHLDVDARLLQDLALYACLRGLVEFEYAAGELPSAVVSAADCQESSVLTHDHSGYGHGVERR